MPTPTTSIAGSCERVPCVNDNARLGVTWTSAKDPDSTGSVESDSPIRRAIIVIQVLSVSVNIWCASIGIVYQDASGLFFDFHSLRCQTATLADAAGVSPRVVQRLMRHSKLEMTGRYTRPRAVDIEAAAGLLPSLKPKGDEPEAWPRRGPTGTTVQPISNPLLLICSVLGTILVGLSRFGT